MVANCYRNHHANFENDRIILTSYYDEKRYLLRTDGRTDERTDGPTLILKCMNSLIAQLIHILDEFPERFFQYCLEKREEKLKNKSNIFVGQYKVLVNHLFQQGNTF